MEFVFNYSTIKTKTINSTAAESDVDIVISEENNFDRKTIIEITEDGTVTCVVLFWSHFSDDAEPSLFWIEDERILFLGAGYVSAVVNIATKDVIDINYPDLFWGWESINGNILELGELNCRLYSPAGDIIGSAPVDPPYDYNATESAISFSSIVMGVTSIEIK
ncbi:hypothetical protein ACOBV9_08740 [Pseudoalteromonas espejiana]